MEDNGQGQAQNGQAEKNNSNQEVNNQQSNKNHSDDIKKTAKVQIDHITFKLDTNESHSQNTQTHLQCSLKYNNQIFSTQFAQEEQSQFTWQGQHTFEVSRQNDDQKIEVEVFEKKENENKIFGKGQIILKELLSSLKEHLNQKVKINHNGQALGNFTFTAKSYIEEDQQDKNKKVNSNEQQSQQQQEQSNTHDNKKEGNHEHEKNGEHGSQQEIKKEQNKEQQQSNKEQKNEQHQQQQQVQLKEENKVKSTQEIEQNNQEHHKQNQQTEQKKQETQHSQINSQNVSHTALEGNKSQKKKTQQDQSMNESIISNKKNQTINDSIVSSKKNFDYNIASKNLKNGYGISEYHSAHTLQTSVHSVSFTKGQRFLDPYSERPSAPYTVLPSSFDNQIRGPTFGSGNRDLLHLSTNPGPGAYDLSTTNLQNLNKKGFVFGVSRSQCKNAIGLMKSDNIRPSQSIKNIYQGGKSYQSAISKDFSNGLKLPALNGSLSTRTLPNYHYTRQKQL